MFVYDGVYDYCFVGFVLWLLCLLFWFVLKSWYMYLVGVLFGFGFDIVIEIGLFVIVVV